MSSPTTTHHGHGASFDRVVHALEAAGMRTRPAPGGATSRCPLAGHAHDDRNPSLSIQYIARDGRTRLRCHMPEHKGREEDILDVLGLGLRDLYDEPRTSTQAVPQTPRPARTRPAGTTPSSTTPARKTKARKKPGQERAEISARYVYLDEDGTNVLRVLRYVPKSFRQQKWDGSRWVWGAPAVEDRVLYRLPQVRAVCQAGGVVHLCEGEKDADAIAAATEHDPAVTATTIPMGAAKWQPHYAEQLRGASLVRIWRDQDDAGTTHARTVHAALTAAGITADVVEAALDQEDKADAADHLAAGLSLDQARTVDPALYTQDTDTAPPGEGTDAEVVQLRTPSTPSGPTHRIPMGRGQWGYCLTPTSEEHPQRGVWTREASDKPWRWVAPLPHMHARIIRRDGSGRRTSTDYLLSATADSRPAIIDHDQLRSAAWANVLGVPLSADDKIQKATVTAILYAAEDAPEHEATPRVAGGRITIPSPETLPAGYLETSRHSPEEARAGWARLIHLCAANPKLALVIGASAIAPFVAATRRQSHMVFLYGEAAQGKTAALNTAASIWGFVSDDPSDDGASIVHTFDASNQGPSRHLGDLGALPPFFDEIGQATYRTPAEWGRFIYNVTNGNKRMTPERGASGTRYSKPWAGVFMAAGNGRILDGLGAGRYAGLGRRVVELNTPLTLDAAHSEAIESTWQLVYGHAGMALLKTHSAETVRPFIDAAASILPTLPSPSGQQVARHLHAHVAGAALLDEWAGTGTTLRDAATTAAIEHLQQWAEPEHDADRLLTTIRDAMGREPAMWPTTTVYEEHRKPRPDWTPETADAAVKLPQHGVDRSLSGLRADDDSWVAVFTTTWKTICADLGLDAAVASRELHARGILHVTDAKRRRGEWVTQMKLTGTGMYKLVLPPDDDHDQPTEPDSATQEPIPWPEPVGREEVVGEDPPGCGSVVGEVVGTNNALTSEVVGVVGVVGQSSCVGARTREGPTLDDLAAHQPCVVCGEPASCAVAGRPVHLGECADELDHRQNAAHEPADGPAAPSGHQEAPAPANARHRPVQATQRRSSRWSAPAAVLTATDAYLPGGLIEDVPGQLHHLGDVAALTQTLALGWGGDVDRLPDLGQLWLTTEALDRLSLPTQLPADPTARDKALRALAQHPAIAGANQTGWQIGTLGTWTRIWHPERTGSGAWIVALPWHNIDGVPLIDDDPEPADLADRLHQVAQVLGMPYRLTPAATGLDLIDHTRPPKRDEHDPRGDNRGRIALVRGRGAELPPFLHNTTDGRFGNIEADFSWWRPFESLREDDRRTYVHAYDRNKSYLTPWRALDLGVDDLVHRTGDAAAWDGKERPGYYRIAPIGWDHPMLPSPIADGATIEDGTTWVTVHTLKQLRMVDVEAQVLESWTWGRTSRYLESAGKILGTAFQTLPAGPARDLLKGIYARSVGKLGQREHAPDYHLWRPDWRHHIIAHARTGIWHTLTQTADQAGTYPLLVDRDLVLYASDDPDPITGWPGQPDRLGTTPGKWKPAGSARLDEWGPAHLPRKVGRWRYDAGVQALSAPEEA